MEAMTVMGMAASQARFLGLTSRKSNVEYQGQQINQERTALANESANLLNQMMGLEVPTPPVQSEYYNYVYSLDGSAGDYASSDYTIVNYTKTYTAENQYKITLSRKEEIQKETTTTYTINTPTVEDGIYKINLTRQNGSNESTASSYTQKLIYDPNNDNPLNEKGELSINKGATSSDPSQIYKVPANTTLIDGYGTCCTKEKYDDDTPITYYFYQDSKGVNHFVTDRELDAMMNPTEENNKVAPRNAYTYYKDSTTTVIGELTKSKNGRLSNIVISNDESYPEELKGKEFSLSTKKEYDEQGYNDAFNEYEYQKSVYEKTISDINSKTEIIQKEDQNLELKLNQLDTEQNAIKTEMDAVNKVIEDNVEKTFKIFA